MLLAPFMAFANEPLDLSKFWKAINYERYEEAKLTLAKARPATLDDVLYIKLCNMYLGMKVANKNKVKRIDKEIAQEIDIYFSLMEDHSLDK